MVVRGRPVGAGIVGRAGGRADRALGAGDLGAAEDGAIGGHGAPLSDAGEVSKRAAGAYFSPRLFDSAVVKRVVRLVQRFCPEAGRNRRDFRPRDMRYIFEQDGKGATGRTSVVRNTLSGRFLLLTVAFVMLAEVLIFVPSVARFRADYLLLRLEKAQIASLATRWPPTDLISAELERSCWPTPGSSTWCCARRGARTGAVFARNPEPIATYDLRMTGPGR
jgi:hypothetical protein